MVIVFDLDDTLYDEIDFVKSGFKEIARYLNDGKYYEFMLNTFEKEGSGKIFDRLKDRFNLSVSLHKLIEIYRFHIPELKLDEESRAVLEFSVKYDLALISDGHYLMQQNKFNALGLDKYIHFPVFTDFYHTAKLEVKPFEIVMNKFQDNKNFVYVSDNPQKDFIVPNKLGWKSIRYKNPNGIYRKYESDATVEVERKIDIIEALRNLYK